MSSVTENELGFYIAEMVDHVEGLDAALLALEAGAGSEAVDAAFRHLHSVKGGSAAMGFPDIQRIAHSLEDAFSAIRESGSHPSAELLSAALDANDTFRRHVQEIASLNVERPLANDAVALGEMLQRLQNLTESPTASAIEGNSSSGVSVPSLTHDSALPTAVSEPDLETILAVAFDENVPLIDLKVRAILRRVAELGPVGVPVPALEDLGSTVRELSLPIHSAISAEALAAALDLEGVVGWRLLSAPLTVDPIEPEGGNPSAQLRDLGNPEPKQTPAAKTASSPAVPSPEPILEATLPPIVDPKQPSRGLAGRDALSTLRVGVVSLDLLADLAGELVTVRSRLSEVVGAVISLLDTLPSIRDYDERAQRVNSLDRLIPKIEDLDLRIDIGNARAEGRAATDDLVEALRLVESQKQLRGQLQRVAEDVGKVVGRLQEATIDLRLVPLESVFRRLRRVVRDASKESGKEVDLVLRGERTGVDKRLIDGLAEPLTHLVRNAIDHGLETTQERLSLGKNPHGQIVLSAAQQGNSVVIELRDDGRGIDLEAVRAKLIHDGRVEGERAAALTRDDLLASIFVAGVTTKETVTSLSGRGVGLDAVQTMLARLHGTVELETSWGHGTTVTLRLPSAMVIVNSLIVAVGPHRLGIPIEEIREVVSLDDVRITPVGKESTMLLRGEFLPVMNLQDSLQLPRTADQPDPRFAVVLHAGPRVIACPIDVALGTEDLVIKSIGDSLGIRRGLSGASFLGDGNVALIVDVGALFGSVR